MEYERLAGVRVYVGAGDGRIEVCMREGKKGRGSRKGGRGAGARRRVEKGGEEGKGKGKVSRFHPRGYFVE